MPRNSLKKLMDMFPYLFDKRITSNFYKSQDVSNNLFKDLYNNLFKVKESFRLNKRLLIWKEQIVPYTYTINFVSSFPNFRNELLFNNPDEDSEVINVPDEIQELLDKLLFWRIDVDDSHFDVNIEGCFSHLKSVTLYKNDTAIYTNSYEDSDDETLIEYSYRNTIANIGIDENDEENNVLDDVFYVEIELWNNEETLTKYLPSIEPQYITASQFLIEVETYDEYHLFKGWPENDTIQEDHYDHDEIPSWLTMNDLRMLFTLNITDIDPFLPSKIIMMQRAGRTDFNEFIKYSRIDDYSNGKLAYVICDSIASDYDMTLHALNTLNTLDVFNRYAMIKLAYKDNMLTGQADNIIAFMQNPIDFTHHDWNPCLNMHMDNVLWNDLSINFIDELTAGHVNMARARNWMLCLYDEYVNHCFDRHYDYMWTTRSMDTLTELFNDMYPYHELPVETQIEAFIGYINDYLHD